MHTPDAAVAAEATAEALLELLRSAAPRAGRTRVAAIDGPSGSGKTTLASAVQGLSDCAVVHLDHVYPGWDGLARTPALVLAELLEPLDRQAPAGVRRYDWKARRRGRWMPVEPVPLLLVEGVGSAARLLRPYLSTIAWVEAPPEVRRDRALARDGEAYRPYWLRWAEQESRFHAEDGTREAADLIVLTAGWAPWRHELRR